MLFHNFVFNPTSLLNRKKKPATSSLVARFILVSGHGSEFWFLAMAGAIFSARVRRRQLYRFDGDAATETQRCCCVVYQAHDTTRGGHGHGHCLNSKSLWAWCSCSLRSSCTQESRSACRMCSHDNDDDDDGAIVLSTLLRWGICANKHTF